MYVMLCMPMFSVCLFVCLFVVFFWGVSFCRSYCPSVIVFLAIGGTCRCEHTLLCEQIVKRHLYIFIHSLFFSPVRVTGMMYIYLCQQ